MFCWFSCNNWVQVKITAHNLLLVNTLWNIIAILNINRRANSSVEKYTETISTHLCDDKIFYIQVKTFIVYSSGNTKMYFTLFSSLQDSIKTVFHNTAMGVFTVGERQWHSKLLFCCRERILYMNQLIVWPTRSNHRCR